LSVDAKSSRAPAGAQRRRLPVAAPTEVDLSPD
jgi:hypothetical protein